MRPYITPDNTILFLKLINCTFSYAFPNSEIVWNYFYKKIKGHIILKKLSLVEFLLYLLKVLPMNIQKNKNVRLNIHSFNKPKPINA